jgi:hypothetical protein
MTVDSALGDSAFMDAFLDVAVPPDASRNLPGAGTLDLTAEVVTGLRADTMLGPMVESGLQAVRAAAVARNTGGLAGMSLEEATKLAQDELTTMPFVMMGLLRYVYPAYYQHPAVLRGIGETARPPYPEGFDVEPTDPELLETLEARGKSG